MDFDLEKSFEKLVNFKKSGMKKKIRWDKKGKKEQNPSLYRLFAGDHEYGSVAYAL
jgi:hypothetical protein